MRQSIFRNLDRLAALAALAVTSAGCGQATAQKAGHAAGPTVTRVEVVKPARATIRRTALEPGQIEAYEVTPIHAKVAGYVREWNVDIGAKVKKGQVLAVLSVPELEAEAEQKTAMVEEAEAKLAQAKAAEEVALANLEGARARQAEVRAGTKRADSDLARWQAEYRRVEQLHNERALTGSLLDETLSKLRSAESSREEVHAQVRTAEAAVRQGQAMLDKARSDVASAAAGIKVARSDVRRVKALLDYATIVAPYDGVVTQRNVDRGDLTEVGARGEPLFVVARDDLVRITVGVPEMYAPEVQAGDRVLVRLQALPGRDFEGKVTRTSWTLDPRSRTLRTEIDVPNPEGTLRPGLYAYATVIVEEHADALSVPTTALVRQDSKTYCVAIQDGRAIRKPVVVGLDDGTRAEILKGLRGDEPIVKAYASSLADGQAVAAIEPETPGAKL
jgi:RND family efflux transporter MFP subunit